MATQSKIRFSTKLFRPKATENIGSATLLTLPKNASAKLPSRGMTMVEGTINGFPFRAPLEPDGQGSHWFRVNETLREGAQADVGDAVTLVIKSTRQWPEPKVPADLKNAFSADRRAHALWMDITPMARWDWIRWIGAAKQLATRHRRSKVATSKLRAGDRRPCCFNRTERTLTDA